MEQSMSHQSKHGRMHSNVVMNSASSSPSTCPINNNPGLVTFVIPPNEQSGSSMQCATAMFNAAQSFATNPPNIMNQRQLTKGAYGCMAGPSLAPPPPPLPPPGTTHQAPPPVPTHPRQQLLSMLANAAMVGKDPIIFDFFNPVFHNPRNINNGRVSSMPVTGQRSMMMQTHPPPQPSTAPQLTGFGTMSSQHAHHQYPNMSAINNPPYSQLHGQPLYEPQQQSSNPGPMLYEARGSMMNLNPNAMEYYPVQHFNAAYQKPPPILPCSTVGSNIGANNGVNVGANMECSFGAIGRPRGNSSTIPIWNVETARRRDERSSVDLVENSGDASMNDLMNDMMMSDMVRKLVTDPHSHQFEEKQQPTDQSGHASPTVEDVFDLIDHEDLQENLANNNTAQQRDEQHDISTQFNIRTDFKHRRGSSMSCSDEVLINGVVNESQSQNGGRIRSHTVTCGSSVGNGVAGGSSACGKQHRQSTQLKSDRYKTELCIYKEELGQCPYGHSCTFAHGQKEIRPRAKHDEKERTQLCEAYENGICYRGSRCWFLHRKPESNFNKLTTDLREWASKLLLEASNDNVNWLLNLKHNPVLPGSPTENDSRIEDWRKPLEPEERVDFGDSILNEHFARQETYREFIKVIMNRPFARKIDSPLETGSPSPKQASLSSKYSHSYEWSSSGTMANDQLIRMSFESVDH